MDRQRPIVAAVIPAVNEGPTIGDVVDTARAASLVDEVIVVDNGSTDDTVTIAAERGARVVESHEDGKGLAMAAGVAATDAPYIVFLDADLTGLRPDHVDRLVRPVLEGRAAMSCGLFDRGPMQNRIFLRALPILTGERALHRRLFESLDRDEVRGFKVEAALNARCDELDLPVVSFVLDGMFHRTKEEKADSPVVGFLRKQRMLLTATWSYASYRVGRRLRRPITPLAAEPIDAEPIAEPLPPDHPATPEGRRRAG